MYVTYITYNLYAPYDSASIVLWVEIFVDHENNKKLHPMKITHYNIICCKKHSKSIFSHLLSYQQNIFSFNYARYISSNIYARLHV